MNEQNYTSLKLSKLLAEARCKLKSNNQWVVSDYAKNGILRINFTPTIVCDGSEKFYNSYDIMNDICIKYCREFFGEKEYCGECNWKFDKACTNPCCDDGYPVKHYEFYTKRILELMQQGRKQEAEEYIWEHCLFNPKNKGDLCKK